MGTKLETHPSAFWQNIIENVKAFSRNNRSTKKREEWDQQVVFWLLAEAEECIQPGLEVPGWRLASSPVVMVVAEDRDPWGAGTLGGLGWAALQSCEQAGGKSTVLGGQEQLRRRKRQLGGCEPWADGASVAGPGQGGGGGEGHAGHP